jgi:hypothetical protein
MEALLRQVDPRLSLHYWDWTTDPRVATGDRVAILTGTAAGSPIGFMGRSSGNGVHDHIRRALPAGRFSSRIIRRTATLAGRCEY